MPSLFFFCYLTPSSDPHKQKNTFLLTEHALTGKTCEEHLCCQIYRKVKNPNHFLHHEFDLKHNASPVEVMKVLKLLTINPHEIHCDQ